jgi:hypothetical protein
MAVRPQAPGCGPTLTARGESPSPAAGAHRSQPGAVGRVVMPVFAPGKMPDTVGPHSRPRPMTSTLENVPTWGGPRQWRRDGVDELLAAAVGSYAPTLNSPGHYEPFEAVIHVLW